jgi:hypothetical protein
MPLRLSASLRARRSGAQCVTGLAATLASLALLGAAPAFALGPDPAGPVVAYVTQTAQSRSSVWSAHTAGPVRGQSVVGGGISRDGATLLIGEGGFEGPASGGRRGRDPLRRRALEGAGGARLAGQLERVAAGVHAAGLRARSKPAPAR